MKDNVFNAHMDYLKNNIQEEPVLTNEHALDLLNAFGTDRDAVYILKEIDKKTGSLDCIICTDSNSISFTIPYNKDITKAHKEQVESVIQVLRGYKRVSIDKNDNATITVVIYPNQNSEMNEAGNDSDADKILSESNTLLREISNFDRNPSERLEMIKKLSKLHDEYYTKCHNDDIKSKCIPIFDPGEN